MEKPLISIIVPIYNVEKYLDECLSSIVSQTYTNLEIILVDDGSPDNCPQMCDDWAKKDSRIKVIHKENGGLVSARKAGCSVSTGAYIMNVDSDDFIGASLVENVIIAINENNSPDIIAFNCLHYFENGTTEPINNAILQGLYSNDKLDIVKNGLLYDKTLQGKNFGNVIYTVWSKAIKTCLYKKFQSLVPNEVTKGEDVAVTIPTVLNCSSIYFGNFNEYYYRANPLSMINSFNKKDFEKEKILFSYLEPFIDKPYSNQLNVYILNMSTIFIKQASISSKKCRTAKIIIKNSITKEIQGRIKSAKLYNLSIKNKFLVFLVKHKMYRSLYLCFKLFK